MRRGFIRLWIVLTVIGVPASALYDFNQRQAVWSAINRDIIKQCVDVEYSNPTHPDALECGKRQGTYKTVFERDGTAPGRYWTGALIGAFIGDLILTAVLIAMWMIGRWVAAGFRPRSGAGQTKPRPPLTPPLPPDQS